MNLYAYCVNDPMDHTDPSGLDAFVYTLSSKTSVDVEILLPMSYKGRTGKDKVSSQEINKYNNGISDYWTGTFKDSEGITYKVKTTAYTPHAGDGTNDIEISSKPGLRSETEIGGNKGVWNRPLNDSFDASARKAGWAAAHEAGHLLGLKDNAPFGKGIMNQWTPGAKPTGNDIRDILKEVRAGNVTHPAGRKPQPKS